MTFRLEEQNPRSCCVRTTLLSKNVSEVYWRKKSGSAVLSCCSNRFRTRHDSGTEKFGEEKAESTCVARHFVLNKRLFCVYSGNVLRRLQVIRQLLSIF
jgi:hypothetical protein